VPQQAKENFEAYGQSVATAVNHYFEALIQGIEATLTQTQTAQGKLANAANYLIEPTLSDCRLGNRPVRTADEILLLAKKFAELIASRSAAFRFKRLLL
jgi:hypothetical protein